MRRSPDQLRKHLVTLVKRVPLEKHEGICDAKDVRPIDLFSALMRVLSSAAYNLAKPWACAVLHPNQCATQGGIIRALSRVALQTECALTNSKSILAVASDFSKMFNMMATSVSSAVAQFMGLSGDVLSFLTKPLDLSSYAWKLPFNARPIEEQHGRGLPQGMAGSVMLAELSIAPLLWRCQSVLVSTPHSTVAYVDDIHFFATDSATLNRILELLFEFQSDFRLNLSKQKSAIWGNEHDALRRIADHYGIPLQKSIEALGAEWPVDSRMKPTYAKETQGIEEAERRILRIKHLPVDLATKYEAVSVACLSLLDYVNHPRMENVRALRMLVKRSLGQRFAAPEILYNCLQASSIDPCVHWLLASLRLWFYVLKIGEDQDILARIVRMCKGRLGWAAESLSKQKIYVATGGVWVGETFFSSEESWGECRKAALQHIKNLQFASLQMRRPNTYSGLSSCCEKQHRKLLKSLPSYEQGVLMKIWTGSAMTKAKHAVMEQADSTCECGEGVQNLEHLLWHCPIQGPPPVDIAYRKDLPPSQAVAHILPRGVDSREVTLWRKSCLRAIMIVSRREVSGDRRPEREHMRERKGHDVAVTEDGAYTYCQKCFISRRSRDASWIFLKQCEHAERESLQEGGHVVTRGHEATMVLATWKHSAKRPQLRCNTCGQHAWATSGFRKECRGLGRN